MGDRIEVLIAGMLERQRQLMRLRGPRRRETAADRRLDRVIEGDRKDRRWRRKQMRRIERGKVKKLGKLGAASAVRRIDPATGEVIEQGKGRT